MIDDGGPYFPFNFSYQNAEGLHYDARAIGFANSGASLRDEVALQLYVQRLGSCPSSDTSIKGVFAVGAFEAADIFINAKRCLENQMDIDESPVDRKIKCSPSIGDPS